MGPIKDIVKEAGTSRQQQVTSFAKEAPQHGPQKKDEKILERLIRLAKVDELKNNMLTK